MQFSIFHSSRCFSAASPLTNTSLSPAIVFADKAYHANGKLSVPESVCDVALMLICCKNVLERGCGGQRLQEVVANHCARGTEERLRHSSPQNGILLRRNLPLGHDQIPSNANGAKSTWAGPSCAPMCRAMNSIKTCDVGADLARRSVDLKRRTMRGFPAAQTALF